MPIVNITLEDILRARDARADAQRRLLRTYRLPLVSFTMNIAGPVKFSPLIELAFDAGLEALRTALGQPVAAEIIRPATGCEALLVYDRPAAALKAACLTLETATPVGRLYDLDVLDTDGNKLSRIEQRTCLICGGPVTVCSRSRTHGLDAIVNRTREILMDFAAGYLAGLAAKALTEEVRLTPKPGLVDEHNNGAHSDMDLSLFLRSIDALTPWFRQITALSLCGADAAALQAAGREAEATMFRATGGVNTHKGALFSFSVLLAALGRHLTEGGDVFVHAAALAAELTPPRDTHGTAVARRHQVGGARAEVLAGFPTARKAAELLQTHDPLTALLWLMAHTEDTNLYHRSGAGGAVLLSGRSVERRSDGGHFGSAGSGARVRIKVSGHLCVKCPCNLVSRCGDLVKVASERSQGLGRAGDVSAIKRGPRARRRSSRVGCPCPRLGSGEA
mgnify:CR=1 FL=1